MLLDIEGERSDATEGMLRSKLTAAIGISAARIRRVKVVVSRLPKNAFMELEHACSVSILLRRRGAVKLAEVGANLTDVIKRLAERIEDTVGISDQGDEELELIPA